MNILVTGATGFVGSALVSELSRHQKFKTTVVVRREGCVFPDSVKNVKIRDISPDTDWTVSLTDIDVVVHAAARAHVLGGDNDESASEFRRVNVEGTLNLAEQAAKAGIKRFVFISSIGVNGNKSLSPFTENSSANPVESFAIFKHEAEQGLRQLADKTGLEVVVVRSPLVYGPNAPGNFGRLVRAVRKGVPLPLGAIYNKRSFVALDNLVDLIVICTHHPAAANQTFLVADGEDLSTTELLQRMAKAMGRPARLIPIPAKILELGLSLIGKKETAQRLCGSLQVDICNTCETLDWVPPLSVDEGLKRAVMGNV